MSYPQRFLYRYYGNKEEYILDVLINKRLYHCQPSEFNDPFDCRPLISIKRSSGNDNDLWRKFLYYYVKMYEEVNKSGIPESELMKEADRAFANGRHKDQSWLDEFIVKELKSLGAEIRVCCFAQSPRNMMMWAHYAKNHRGLALIFRSSQLLDKSSSEFRGQVVEYNSEPLGIERFVHALERRFDHGDVSAMANIIYAKKTKHWVGEDEIRFFSMPDHPYLEFNEAALYGIVFGAKTSKFLIQKVRGALDHWRIKPGLFKASIEKSTHKLWIEKYKDTQQENPADAD
jgi:hypothetical protein